MKLFLDSLIIVKKSKEEKYRRVYVCTGSNNILLVLPELPSVDKPINSKLCNTTC